MSSSTIQYYHKNTIAVGEKGDVNIYDFISGTKISQFHKNIGGFCNSAKLAFATFIPDKQFAFVDINNYYLHIFTRPQNAKIKEESPEN